MQRAIKQILLMGAFALATGGQSLAADIYLPQRAPVAYVARRPSGVQLERHLYRRQRRSSLEPRQRDRQH